MQKNYAENKAPSSLSYSLASNQHASDKHASVMTQEVVELFAPLGDGLVLDATFGRGGHTRALLTQTSCRVFAIDCDHEAIAYANANPFFQERAERFAIAQGFFASASELLAARGIHALDGVLFDYGISSAQLDNPERGFSFQRKGPLDMRMAQQGASEGEVAPRESALEFLQNVSEARLVEQFRQCGEPKARKLARALLKAREDGCLPQDTQELAQLVRKNTRSTMRRTKSKNSTGASALKNREKKTRAKNKKDSATLAFMAIRIAVNNELEQIEEGLRQADKLLKDKGRIVAISFHSLEDRIVKRQFSLWTGRSSYEPTISRHHPSLRDSVSEPNVSEPSLSEPSVSEPSVSEPSLSELAGYRCLPPRLQRPLPREILENPRARSAKLRAVEKCASSKKNEYSSKLAAKLLATKLLATKLLATKLVA